MLSIMRLDESRIREHTIPESSGDGMPDEEELKRWKKKKARVIWAGNYHDDELSIICSSTLLVIAADFAICIPQKGTPLKPPHGLVCCWPGLTGHARIQPQFLMILALEQHEWHSQLTKHCIPLS